MKTEVKQILGSVFLAKIHFYNSFPNHIFYLIEELKIPIVTVSQISLRLYFKMQSFSC